MTQVGRATFALIKGLLAKSSLLVIMNEEDPLILYTDASTRGIDADPRWDRKAGNLRVSCPIGSSDSLGIMELELYAFVYCVNILAPIISCEFIGIQKNWCVGA